PSTTSIGSTTKARGYRRLGMLSSFDWGGAGDRSCASLGFRALEEEGAAAAAGTRALCLRQCLQGQADRRPVVLAAAAAACPSARSRLLAASAQREGVQRRCRVLAA